MNGVVTAGRKVLESNPITSSTVGWAWTAWVSVELATPERTRLDLLHGYGICIGALLRIALMAVQYRSVATERSSSGVLVPNPKNSR